MTTQNTETPTSWVGPITDTMNAGVGFRHIADKAMTRVNRLLGQTGRLLWHEIKGPREYVTMEYPLDKTGQASMRLRCARSTVDTAVQEKWVMEVRIVNFIDGEERSLKMERFIGSEGWRVPMVLDSALQRSPYYLLNQNIIITWVPESGVEWIGVLLHEIGHSKQYQRTESPAVHMQHVMCAMDLIRDNEEEFQPGAIYDILDEKEEILSSCSDVVEVLVRKGTISHEERAIISDIFQDILEQIRDLKEDWEGSQRLFRGRRVQEVWMDLLTDSCARTHTDGTEIFQRFRNLMNALFERDATAYALRALRQIDRELGTTLSTTTFREAQADGTVFEGTIREYLAWALSTYGAHRGDDGIAPGTRLPRFSDFDIPSSPSDRARSSPAESEKN